jgi:hypothetical protein
MIYDQLAQKHGIKPSEPIKASSSLSQAQQQQLASRFPNTSSAEEQISNILRYIEARKEPNDN